jgi:hypothetical protein
MHSIAEKDISHHLSRPAELNLMHNGPVAQKNPMVSVRSLNADPGFVACHNIGLAQVVDKSPL